MKTYSLTLAASLLLLSGCPANQPTEITSLTPLQATSNPSKDTDVAPSLMTHLNPQCHDAAPDAPPAGTDPLYWSPVVKLYQQAVESGQTTAGSAAQWTSDLWQQTSDTSSQFAGSTKDWLMQSFESAKATGATSATSTSDFFKTEMAKIGSWEYQVIEIGPLTPQEKTEQLNQLGVQRWECMATGSLQDNRSQFVFKRKVKSQFDNIPTKDLARFILMIGGGGLLSGGDSQE